METIEVFSDEERVQINVIDTNGRWRAASSSGAASGFRGWWKAHSITADIFASAAILFPGEPVSGRSAGGCGARMGPAARRLSISTPGWDYFRWRWGGASGG